MSEKNKKEKEQTLDEPQSTEEKIEETASADDEKKEGVSKEDMTPEEYVEFLETELGKNIALAEENKNTALRLRADFDNYKKRNESISTEMRILGECSVLEKILEVIDNLDRAKEMINGDDSLKGFELIEQQLKAILSKYDVKEIEVKDGDDFDPNKMTAVMREENEEMKGKVLQVLLKGYIKGDSVLRYAMVKEKKKKKYNF